MAAQKKIIKADAVKMMGTRVETVEFGGRRFGEKVFKKVSVDNEAVEMEAEFPEIPEEGTGEKKAGEVKLEKFYDEQGNLTGLKIHCKCGDLIELEFPSD